MAQSSRSITPETRGGEVERFSGYPERRRRRLQVSVPMSTTSSVMTTISTSLRKQERAELTPFRTMLKEDTAACFASTGKVGWCATPQLWNLTPQAFAVDETFTAGDNSGLFLNCRRSCTRPGQLGKRPGTNSAGPVWFMEERLSLSLSFRV